MHTLAVLLIRLMGVLYLVSWLVAVPSILADLRYTNANVVPLPNAWWLAVYPPIISLMVVLLAPQAAGLMVPKAKADAPADEGLTQRGLMQVGTALIGIFVLGTNVHTLVGMVLLGAFDGAELFTPFMWQTVMPPAIGILIILLARFAPRLLERGGPARRPDPGSD